MSWYGYTNKQSAPLYKALGRCGGSEFLGKNLASPDYRAYLLVGQCGAGLAPGYSQKLGLEAKHALPSMSLEVFHPFSLPSLLKCAI